MRICGQAKSFEIRYQVIEIEEVAQIFVRRAQVIDPEGRIQHESAVLNLN